jgi:carbon starvation protein
MTLLHIVLLSATVLLLAYRWYGSVLARLLGLDPTVPTPAVQQCDNVDYVPIEPKLLLGQHFSAIAAAGPVVGPILAGAMFGWLPALLWILFGSIFIGGVHDMTALVASVRHRARSTAEVVREHMTHRSYVLFLSFVWLSLIYIIVAFTDVTSQSFLGQIVLENGQRVRGGGIATSSLLYLALPIAMALALRFGRISVGLATAIFLPLVGLAIWCGQWMPFDVAEVFSLSPSQANKLWNCVLLAYCFAASLAPMWLLLQPRGHLGGCFLYLVLAGGLLGIVFGGRRIEYPAFLGWETAQGISLFPFLFITIACGACSGFHSIIASGTTSKQLCRETDARPIGYGSMLLEAMVAVVSLGCVMMLSPASELVSGPGGAQPNLLYALGVGNFLTVVGVPASFGVAFGLMAFTTFVYDTLDVCTRLGRYILQELFGWEGRPGRWAATALTAGAPLVFLLWQPTDGSGKIVPVWKIFWELFGTSNQLLAALTLLGVTVWLWRQHKAAWAWLVTGVPMAWMFTISLWALVRIIGRHIHGWELPANPVPYVALLLFTLAVLMMIEAVRVLRTPAPPPPAGQPALAVGP